MYAYRPKRHFVRRSDLDRYWGQSGRGQSERGVHCVHRSLVTRSGHPLNNFAVMHNPIANGRLVERRGGQ